MLFELRGQSHEQGKRADALYHGLQSFDDLNIQIGVGVLYFVNHMMSSW